MKSIWASLWNWERPIDRGPYLVIGLLLFALKHHLDRWVASYGFQRKWSVFNYWMPDAVFRMTTLPENDRRLFVSLFVLALPCMRSSWRAPS